MELLNLTSANLTNSTGPPAQFIWNAGTKVSAVIMFLCFLVGFPGNIAALILRPNWQQLSTLTQSLIVNLASSDLLCLVTLPFWIYNIFYDWAFGDVGCKIIKFLEYCSIYTSLLTVTALSVQRYMQVVHPHRSLKFKKRLLGLMWIMSMLLSIPMLVVHQVTEDEQKISCVPHFSSQAQQLAVLLAECTFGLSSFILSMGAYITLNRKLTQTAFLNRRSILVTTVIITFSILWLPCLFFRIVIVGGLLSNNQIIVQFYHSGTNIFSGLVFINSSINPIIYVFASGICKRKSDIQQE